MKGEFDKSMRQEEMGGYANKHNEKYMKVMRGGMDLSDNQHAGKVYYVDSTPDVDHDRVKWKKAGYRGYSPKAYDYEY